MSRKTVTIFLMIKVGGHFVMSIVKCHKSHYVGVLDNPLIPHTKKGLYMLFPPHNSSSFQSNLIPRQVFFHLTFSPKSTVKTGS